MQTLVSAWIPETRKKNGRRVATNGGSPSTAVDTLLRNAASLRVH